MVYYSKIKRDGLPVYTATCWETTDPCNISQSLVQPLIVFHSHFNPRRIFRTFLSLFALKEADGSHTFPFPSTWAVAGSVIIWRLTLLGPWILRSVVWLGCPVRNPVPLVRVVFSADLQATFCLWSHIPVYARFPLRPCPWTAARLASVAGNEPPRSKDQVVHCDPLTQSGVWLRAGPTKSLLNEWTSSFRNSGWIWTDLTECSYGAVYLLSRSKVFHPGAPQMEGLWALHTGIAACSLPSFVLPCGPTNPWLPSCCSVHFFHQLLPCPFLRIFLTLDFFFSPKTVGCL